MSQPAADWHQRVVGRSLRVAQQRSIDRGAALIRAAAALLERSNGDGFTVQQVADEAGQSLRTLYQHFESKDDLLLAVFEEAMRDYAWLLRASVAALDDPLDRLAGVLLATIGLPARSSVAVNRSLSRLRLKLTEAEPELVGRSQAPVAALLAELLDAAVAARRLPPVDRDEATFLLLTLVTATVHSATLGNDVGPTPPDGPALVAFALRGLGAKGVDAAKIGELEPRLRYPARTLTLDTAPREATQ
jgi:AcrR family transcriptional regulator